MIAICRRYTTRTMPSLPRGVVALFTVGASLLLTGCLEQWAVNAQVRAMNKATGSIDTLHDVSVARSVAQAGLGQLEGMYMLAPDNDDLKMLLLRGWSSATFAFAVDDYEAAHAEGAEYLAEYHLLRARRGFDRARFYGMQLLRKRADGFDAVRKNANLLDPWLDEHFTQPEDAELLAWLGFAWAARVAAAMDVPKIVGDLWIAISFTRHSLELDETTSNALGHVVMGMYYSHGEVNVEKAKDHLDRSIELTGGTYLPNVLSLASGYHCAARNEREYFETLERVVTAGDVMPSKRLQNTVSMLRALRYQKHRIFQEPCGFDADG